MWRIFLLLGAVVLSGLGTPALAGDDDFPRLGRDGDFSLEPPKVKEGPEAGWYLRADVGYVMPQMGAVSAGGVPLATTGDLGDGWSIGGGFGYRLAPPFRLEGSIDYLSLGSATTTAGRIGADATVALASLYWDVTTIAGFTPYVGGGVGFGIVSFDPPAGVADGGNDWGLAFSLAAGVSYAITSQWSADLGYRYIHLGARGTSGLGALPGLEAEDLATHQVRLGVRYAIP